MSAMKVKINAYNLTDPEDGKLVSIISINGHESSKWSGKLDVSNIAILQASLDLYYPELLKPGATAPIYLPHHDVDKDDCLMVAGWGTRNTRSDVPRKVKVGVVNVRDCPNFDSLDEHHHMHRVICAGKIDDKADGCVSDFGGPLFRLNDSEGRYELAGLYDAKSMECVSSDRLSYYVHIARYLEWITKSTKEHYSCPVIEPETNQRQRHGFGTQDQVGSCWW